MHSIVRLPFPSIFYHAEELVVLKKANGVDGICLWNWSENGAPRTSCDRDQGASVMATVCKYRLRMWALHQSDTKTCGAVVKVKVLDDE